MLGLFPGGPAFAVSLSDSIPSEMMDVIGEYGMNLGLSRCQMLLAMIHFEGNTHFSHCGKGGRHEDQRPLMCLVISYYCCITLTQEGLNKQEPTSKARLA